MDTNVENKCDANQTQQTYVKPETKKHEPVKIVQGSGDSGSCSGLYYVALYYY
jgi:hypothetical protein